MLSATEVTTVKNCPRNLAWKLVHSLVDKECHDSFATNLVILILHDSKNTSRNFQKYPQMCKGKKCMQLTKQETLKVTLHWKKHMLLGFFVYISGSKQKSHKTKLSTSNCIPKARWHPCLPSIKDGFFLLGEITDFFVFVSQWQTGHQLLPTYQ